MADIAISTEDASLYPLARVNVGADTVSTLECSVPGSDAWTKHSVTIIAVFQGKGALVDEETQ